MPFMTQTSHWAGAFTLFVPRCGRVCLRPPLATLRQRSRVRPSQFEYCFAKFKTGKYAVIYGRLVALRHRGQVAVLALIALLFLAHVVGLATVDRTITNGQIIAGDGLLYYEYLPFVILDGHLKEPYQRGKLRDAKTRTSLIGNPMPVGWALLTSPFFLIGHGLSLALATMGVAVRLDGYGLIDQFVTNLGAVVYGPSASIFAIARCVSSLMRRSGSCRCCFRPLREPSIRYCCYRLDVACRFVLLYGMEHVCLY